MQFLESGMSPPSHIVRCAECGAVKVAVAWVPKPLPWVAATAAPGPVSGGLCQCCAQRHPQTLRQRPTRSPFRHPGALVRKP